MNNKKCCLFTFLIPAVLIAKTVQISSILETVKDDKFLQNQENTIDHLNSNSNYLPFIDEFEFRVNSVNSKFETANWFQKQKYSIRITPNNIGETFAARKVQKSMLDYSLHRKEKLINSLLKERYLLVIEMLYNCALYNRCLEMKVLLEDRISVLEKMINTEDIDFSDFVKAETDYSELQLNLIEIKNVINFYEVQINNILPYTDSVQIDTTNLVDVTTLKRELQRSVINLDSNNIYLKECLLKLRTAQDMFHFESKTRKKFISYLDFEFDADRLMEEKLKDKTPEYNKSLAFGFGVTIPIANTDRVDINRRMLNMYDDKEDFIFEKKEIEDSTRMLQTQINALIKQYELLTDRRELIKTESLLGKYSHIEGEDPLILLKIRQSIIDNEMMMDEVKYKVYKKFIQMMDITGKLSEYPLRNFLSKDRDVLK